MVSSLSLLVNIGKYYPHQPNQHKHQQNINMPMKITMKSTHPLGNGLYHLFLVIWEMVYGIVLRTIMNFGSWDLPSIFFGTQNLSSKATSSHHR